MKIMITVNGKKNQFDREPNDSLLNILREDLALTGTKNGCAQGHCGACVVVVNGKAVKSCITKVKKLENAEIITIEGISSNYKLHVIQEAFITKTAVQCGFCTPGYIMELFALFENSLNPTEAEIRKALEGHLCRCTGYEPILEAARLANKLLNE